MSYKYKHIRPGEQVALSAESYNAMIDAAAADARNRNLRLSPTNTERDSLCVWAVNKTGKSLKRFDVIGLDWLYSSPDSAEFNNTIIFNGVVPRSIAFAILQQSAEPNDVVRVRVSGVSIARVQKIYNESEDYKYCNVYPGSTEFLYTSTHGPAKILWKNSGRVGITEWAIIRFGYGTQNTIGIYEGLIMEKTKETLIVSPNDGSALIGNYVEVFIPPTISSTNYPQNGFHYGNHLNFCRFYQYRGKLFLLT